MSYRRARHPGLVVILLVRVLIGSAAVAAPEGDDEGLLREGVLLRRQGRDEAALVLFRSAWRIKRTARAQAQMGLAEHALGHWVGAEEDLKGALAVASDPWITKNFATLDRALRSVREHLGQLQVLGAPRGARVKAEDQDLGELPMQQTASVPAGDVVISVAAPGYISINRKVTVPPKGAMVRETIVLRPVEEAPTRPGATASAGSATVRPPMAAAVPANSPSPPPAVRAGAKPEAPPSAVAARPADGSGDGLTPHQAAGDGGSWQRTAAYVAGGAGVLFLGAAVAAQLASSSKNKEFNDVTNAPNDTMLCNKKLPNAGGGRCSALADDADRMKSLALVGYVAAGATLAGAVILFLLSPSRGDGAGGTSVACGATVGAGGMSCAFMSRF